MQSSSIFSLSRVIPTNVSRSVSPVASPYVVLPSTVSKNTGTYATTHTLIFFSEKIHIMLQNTYNFCSESCLFLAKQSARKKDTIK